MPGVTKLVLLAKPGRESDNRRVSQVYLIPGTVFVPETILSHWENPQLRGQVPVLTQSKPHAYAIPMGCCSNMQGTLEQVPTPTQSK